MDQDERRDMGTCEDGESHEDVVLPEKDALLGELAANLALSFSVSPIVSTAIVEHVFQELLRQFYQKGETYLPNFGLFRYSENENCHEFLPCDSFVRNLDRMKEANESDRFLMALIERKASQCLSEK